MSISETDMERRQFLTAATSVLGGIGLGLASVPFVGSWLPSAKTKALGAPVEVDLSNLEEGQKITVAWRGQPIFIVHRSQSSIDGLVEVDGKLRDPDSSVPQQPDYITGRNRSLVDKYLVVLGLCTHLGCVPLFKPKEGSVDTSWRGGFFCPCHGSKFDMSGRVYKSVPAPTNLSVPPHHYIEEKILLIGEDPA